MIKSGQSVTVEFTTVSPETGELEDADSTPTGTLVVNGDDNGASVTVTNKATGIYKAAVTLPSLSAGDVVSLRVAATVFGIPGASVVWQETADTKLVSELNDFDPANDTVGLVTTVTNLTNLPAAAALEATVQAILEDTGTTLPALISAELSSSSDSTASGAISRTRGNTWTINATIGAVTGYTSLWFTVKHSQDDADSEAILQIKLNSSGTDDDLLYVNGATATDATKGTITVSDDTTGAIIIAVDETVTDDMPVGTFYYDIQALISGAVTTPDSGTFTITADVTRSVT